MNRVATSNRTSCLSADRAPEGGRPRRCSRDRSAQRSRPGSCPALAMAALMDSCVMGLLLSKPPYNRDANCDLQTALAELTDTRRTEPAVISSTDDLD